MYKKSQEIPNLMFQDLEGVTVQQHKTAVNHGLEGVTVQQHKTAVNHGLY